MSIKKLDQQLISDICVNQVIVDLSICVKELLENSLDAGSTDIEIQFVESGFHSIQVSDNGTGISRKDLDSIVKKGATSKLTSDEDLTNIISYGFRGEALNAIARMGKLQIITKNVEESGWKAEFDQKTGIMTCEAKQVNKVGATVSVSQLFENYPIRYVEFKKNLKNHYKKALTLIESYGLIRTDVRILAYNITNGNKKELVYSNTGPNTTLLNNIRSLLGAKVADTLGEVKHTCEKFTLLCYATKTLLSGSVDQRAVKKDIIMAYINKRPINLPKKLVAVLDEAYKQYNSGAKYVFIASFEMSPSEYDINLSVDKFDVYFKDPGTIIAEVKKMLDTFLEDQRANLKTASELVQKKIQFETKKSGKFDKSKSKEEPKDEGTRDSKMMIEEKLPQQNPIIEENDIFMDEEEYEEEDEKAFPRAIAEERALPQNIAEEKNTNNVSDNSTKKRAPPCELSELVEPELQRMKLKGEANDEESNKVRGNQQITNVERIQVENSRKLPEKPSSTRNEKTLQSKTEAGFTASLFRQYKDSLSTASIQARSRELPKFSFRKSIEEPAPKEGAESPISDNSGPAIKITEITYSKPTNPEVISEKPILLKSRTFGESPDDMDAPIEQFSAADDENTNKTATFTIKNYEKAFEGSIKENLPPAAHKPQVFFIRLDEAGNNMQPTSPIQISKLKVEQKTPKSNEFRLQKSVSENKSSEKITIDTKKFIKELTYVQDFDQNNEEISLAFKKEYFPYLEISGQFNLGFIVAFFRKTGELFLIDQHASNEKENFEALLNNFKVESQVLVLPQTVELSFSQKQTVKENIENLKKNGYSVDKKSLDEPRNQVRLIAVPSHKNYTLGANDFQELVDILSEKGTQKEYPRTSSIKKMLATRACRSSIMIGEALNMQTMRKVVSDLGTLKSPWNCPHGRPTLIKLGKIQTLSQKITRSSNSRKCSFKI